MFKHYAKAAFFISALTVQSCKECTLECDNNIIADVTDANGSIVNDFVITATVEGVAITVDCKGEHDQATSATIEGHAVRVRCREAGVFLIENVTQHDYTITVDITGNGQSFSGPLVRRDVPTKDGNGTSCGDCTYASPQLE